MEKQISAFCELLLPGFAADGTVYGVPDTYLLEARTHHVALLCLGRQT